MLPNREWLKEYALNQQEGNMIILSIKHHIHKACYDLSYKNHQRSEF